jgi:hypothetical protein
MALRSVRAVRAGAAVALALVAAVAYAQVPSQLALMVMLKVITYDTGFAGHGGGEFVIAVPYAKGEEASANEAVATSEAIDLKSINDRPLKFVTVPAAELSSNKASAVLLHAGMSAGTAREVLAHAAKAKLYSLAFDEQLVKDGAMLGVASNGGKPQVLINVVTARAAGVEFGPSVLKVARTFQ